ncbi:MAG: 4Fe-4S double cluster binding domain-containing protein [Clostridiales bacterium]|nr:4Fe-4S double cluster binding domain-containing protein [Clostridiales bacterium]
MNSPINVISELKNLMAERGIKFTLTSAVHLNEIQSVSAVKRNGELGEIHPFFIKRQDCAIPDCAKSVLLLAIPLPLYYECVFHQDSKEYRMYGISAIQPDMTEFVAKTFKKHDHFIEAVNNLRFKRLAVQSGLAEYGRNNITYVAGMGSNVRYAAFYTDIDVHDETWRDVCNAEMCADCGACIKNCPTGAIRADRFMIDSYNCLAGMTEEAAPFPDWVSKTAHHSIYDCVRCQICCPLNMPLEKPEEIVFDEQETRIILSGAPYGDVSNALTKKIYDLGLAKWPDGIPRNIRLVFDLIDKGLFCMKDEQEAAKA